MWSNITRPWRLFVHPITVILMHFLSGMSAIRSRRLCCEQISVWLSRFRGQTPSIRHIWQPSRYSPEGDIHSILNLTFFSLFRVHFCFIKERIDMWCIVKHPLATHLIVIHPNIQRRFSFRSKFFNTNPLLIYLFIILAQNKHKKRSKYPLIYVVLLSFF